ncbi:unnamed protein product [Adineta steineri]|uniref:Uncharacterized protein n=1 Tax=Adineta steineri TaxID=433720 RepID=A0A814ZWL3_9BILA|nr:unnamed protein product [Adineta steineri]
MSSNNNTSITSAILQLQSAFRYPSLILGFILLIGGVLGNILNIIVFIKVGNYKKNACSLYMFIRTFLDLNVLLAGLTTRILSAGFQIDFTLMNRIWCKTRLGFIDINSEMISIFGFLTVRHMKAIGVTRLLSSLTRQTVSMALFQILAVLMFNGPYSAWQIYSVITANVVKDNYRRAVEQLINSFAATYDYGPFASSFYCYCLSKRFRNQLIVSLKEVVGCIHTNQVFPNP